ncbi:MAG: universal stress protein [Nocardioides sp.]
MNTPTTVVVGYDGSPDSLAAITWAARTASLRGASLVVTTIVDPRDTPRGVAWPESYWKDLEAKAREPLASWPDVPVTFERHGGHLVPRLVDAARESAMVVLGSHGHTRVGEILRGSVSQSTARHTEIPVVVVRPALSPDAGRIVVGADSTDASTHAIAFACRTAQLTGEKVMLLHAWHPITLSPDRYGYTPPVSYDTLSEAESALTRIVDATRDEFPDVDIQSEIFNGPAEVGLVDASNAASLVVVGTRGLGAVGQALMGSVSEHVLHKAHCPVAVVH